LPRLVTLGLFCHGEPSCEPLLLLVFDDDAEAVERTERTHQSRVAPSQLPA